MIKLLFDKIILEWINKNKITFIMLMLFLGNVYQFVNNQMERKEYREELREVNMRLHENSQNSLSYERDRSNSLETLLQSILKMYAKVDERKDTIIHNISTNNNTK